MPYVLHEDNNHVLDEDGNKIEFNVSYEDIGDWYKHKEPLHINDDGHLDTEDRHIIIKDGIQPNHAVCKKQLDEINNNKYSKQDIDNKLLALQSSINTSITALFKAHEAKILTQMLNFRNEQIKNRIQRKYLTIPKTPHQWIKLFDNTDVGDSVFDLKNVIILNVWIRRYDRFHNAKSALLEKDFHNSIEFFFNADMTGYYTYFTHAPSNWNMSCFIEWLRIPQPISINNENIPISKPNNSNE